MKPFDDILHSAGAAPKLAAAWQGAVVTAVDVLKSQAAWRIYIACEQLLPSSQVSETERFLLRRFSFLQELSLVLKLNRPEALDQAMRDLQPELEAWLKQVPEGETLALKDLEFCCDGDMIDVVTAEEQVYQRLLDTEFCSHIAQWFEQRHHMPVIARVLLKQEMSPARAEQKYVSSRLPENIDMSGLSPDAGNGARRAKNERPPREGKIKERAVPIAELQEGMKNAVIQGEVVKRTVNNLKNGGVAVVYDITDYGDTISVKSFLDRESEDKIKAGDWIRVKGAVRFDEYVKEAVVFMERYMPAAAPLREDKAKRRRVELHAHTKMSDMDGLTDIEALVKRAAAWKHPALAITDHGGVQAFPIAAKAASEKGLKLILGVEGYLVEDDVKDAPWHVIILARNLIGLRHLYELVSISYMDNFYKRPKLKRSDIMARREGLLLGTACEAGELFRAVLKGAPEQELAAIVDFYDYLEIQPLCNNMFMVRKGEVKDEAALEDINRRIVALGKTYNKPVVATGDVHFLEPHDEILRTIIQAGKGFDDSEESLPLYYRTTEEMLEQFAHLGEEEAYRAVVEAPNEIADLIEPLSPVPDRFCPPVIESAEREITEMTWSSAHSLYGEAIPPIVYNRIERELDSIVKHGFGVLYLIAHKLVKKSNEEGYMVGSRGSVGSSLVAFLTGITEVNALPPHYVCPACRFSDFAVEASVEVGADLPEKQCPQCGAMLLRDGFNIPFETFLGFDGDKVPDIDLNFSGEYQAKAHKFMEELFGAGNVFKAGTVSTVKERIAYGFVKGYAEERNRVLRRAETERLVNGISGVKRTTGQHPGGMIVVPDTININEFTPIQHPADNKGAGIVTTHFEYHSLENQLVKLDILGHDDPTVLKVLEDLTGVNAREVSLSDKEVMKLFSGVEVMGIKPEAIGSEVGTFGIPEFGTRFVRQMLEVTRPTTFGELVRISGLSHGTDVWQNNAHTLITQGTATLRETICTRDDIMGYLIQKGMDKKEAFTVMEKVRRGKGLAPSEMEAMIAHQVPEWYIASCQRIKYMFPKAHAAAYVTMGYRIAWFKLNHPLAFYAAYFSVRADDFEADTILGGYETIRKRLTELNALGRDISNKEVNLQIVLELALEMCARGFCFHPIDLYESAAEDFIIKDNGLRLPFSVLPGVGAVAAHQFTDAREEGPFLSVEDLQSRSRLNRTAIEQLRRNHCFADLPESNQLGLF
ncbi:MAG: PolC-type DNA polymerase III [Syntrophomonadaceae bacterium]|nr:PolC-type DNA polymerase III [Syntrophomonadaceae bacterium]